MTLLELKQLQQDKTIKFTDKYDKKFREASLTDFDSL